MEVTYINHMGDDLSVVNAARVSFSKVSEEMTEKDVRLIKYLAKHKHLSPFNHAFLSYRVKAPVFVARQLVKHEYMPWNEISRRYVDSSPEFYNVPHEWRLSADNVKQGSSDEFVDPYTSVYIQEEYQKLLERSLEVYEFFKRMGVCPEQSRMVLPHSLMTEWIWSGSLGAFAKMLSLRLASDTQYETQLIAKKIYADAKERFPVSLKALLKEAYNIDEEFLND